MKGSAEDCPGGVITTPVSMDPPPPPPSSSPQTRNAPKPPKFKSVGDAYVLGIPLGVLGIHHFYLGSPGMGLAYLFTLGCGGIGWIADWFRMPMLVKDANRKIERKWKMQNEDPAFTEPDIVRYELDTKRLSDCYILGFVVGVLGLHHFYLRRTGWGILYLFTLGLMGCGWIMDWFRMPVLYKRYKTKLKLKAEGKDDGFPEERHLDDAYALGFPLGILGFHHFYLKRPCWGLLYFFTLGMLGIGFLIDLFRMKSLVDDANRRIRAKVERERLICGHGTPVYTTSQDTVTYITPPATQQPNGPPGAPESYQHPGQHPYSYPYPNTMTPVPGLQPYTVPPPQAAQASPPSDDPPPYTASAMPDPDGIPVEKPGISGTGVSTGDNSNSPPSLPEKKTDLV